MPSKSKSKGNGFEREVSKYLSELYDASFQRVIGSGAFTGGKNTFRKGNLSEGQIRSHKGDIVPPDEWKRFNCECKNYASFPFHLLLHDKPIPIFEEWTKQTIEASDPGDVNIIFMKFNRIGKYIAVEACHGFKFNRKINYKAKDGSIWYITEMDSFFNLNKDSFEKSVK